MPYGVIGARRSFDTKHIQQFNGNNKYVSQITGNDNNDGMYEKSFRTIMGAIGSPFVQSGDILHVEGSNVGITYDEAVIVSKRLYIIFEDGVFITNSVPGTVIEIQLAGGMGTVIEGGVVISVNQIGVNMLPFHCACRNVEVANASIGFNVNGTYSTLQGCVSRQHTVTGFNIVSPIDELINCSAFGDGGAVRGFYLSGVNADHSKFINCHAHRNTTADYETIAGADNNIFDRCSMDSGGVVTDAGANNYWTSFREGSQITAGQTADQDARDIYNNMNDGIYVDAALGIVGTAITTGTKEIPSSNMTDARTMAIARNLRTFYIVNGNFALPALDFTGYEFIGHDYTTCIIDINSRTVTNATFRGIQITGINTSAGVRAYASFINNFTTTSIELHASHVSSINYQADGTDILSDNCFFRDGCTINFASKANCTFRCYHVSGSMWINNMNQVSDVLTVYCDNLNITLDVSCNLATANLYSNHKLTNNAPSTLIVNVYVDTQINRTSGTDGINYIGNTYASILGQLGGLIKTGKCDSGMVASTVSIVCAQLKNFTDGFFGNNWYLGINLNSNSVGNAPEKEWRRVTAYSSATGTFTTEAFSANVEANDMFTVCRKEVLPLFTDHTVNMGICDTGMAASTTTVVSKDLSGKTDDFFNNVGTQAKFWMTVIKNNSAVGTAPEGETRMITDYVSSTGTFTVQPFSANVEAGDFVAVILDTLFNKLELGNIFNLVNSDLVLNETGGSVTTDGTVQNLYINNSPSGVFKPLGIEIDFDNMLAGDSVSIIISTIMYSGGGYKQSSSVFTYTGADGGLPGGKVKDYIPFYPNRFGIKITIQRTMGTDRAYMWEVFKES